MREEHAHFIQVILRPWEARSACTTEVAHAKPADAAHAVLY